MVECPYPYRRLKTESAFSCFFFNACRSLSLFKLEKTGYNIYVVDLDTEDFIEYSSPAGQDQLAVERHGKEFFAAVHRDVMTRIYKDDREMFLTWFTKENVIREVDGPGAFTAAYRLIDSGSPVSVSMKVTRLRGTNRIILGVSIADALPGRPEKPEP